MNEKQRRADRYLTQLRNASKELTELILRIDYLRYKASGIGAIRYDKDRVMTSPEDMVCESIAEAVYLEGRLSARNEELKAMREHTEQVIGLWSDNNARFIDIYYLNHGSMTEAADRIGCTSRNVYNIKFKALEEFAKYIQ
jgi:DNA-directed RNA polymerase specialized sigma24 family protein